MLHFIKPYSTKNHKGISLLFKVLLAAMLAIAGCGKSNPVDSKNGNNNNSQSSIQVYDVKAHPGKKRIKFTWKLSASNTTAKKTVISWNSDTDSLIVPVHSAGTGGIKDSVIINSLSEGKYKFVFTGISNDGTRSTQILSEARVYGPKYQSSLKNRKVRDISYNKGKSTLDIQWNTAPTGSIGSELEYKDAQVKTHHLFVPSHNSDTHINGFDLAKDSLVIYRTLFLPTTTAIDTFYTDYDTLNVRYYYGSSGPATVLWNGDASNGFNVWKVIDIEGHGNVSIVNIPGHGPVWKFYKPSGSHRTEGHGAKGFEAKEGDVIYIGWQFKLKMPVNTTTNAIFQWKAYGPNMMQNYPVVLKPVMVP